MSSADSLLVPRGTRLVHIGPHKTGTTAVQVALDREADVLPAHGVTYVGGVDYHRPARAGWALGLRGRPVGKRVPDIRQWERLVRQVAEAGTPRVCVSNEDFGRARPPQIRRIVDDLGGDRVHVVAVARRFDRYLPSQWQQRVKAGDTRAFGDWLHAVLDTGEERSWNRQNVWFAHDTAALVSRWVDVVGPDRFTLIVADENDPDRLMRSVEGLLGLPQGLLQTYPDRSNRGLTWAETELVRALHTELDLRGVSRAGRRTLMRTRVIADMLALETVPAGPRRPPFPEWAARRVAELSDQRVQALREARCRVIGDIEGLRAPADLASTQDSVPPALGYDVAARAVIAAADLGAASRDNEAR